MNKTKNKPKALKNKPNQNTGFFKALLFGFFSCAVVWIVLAIVFAFIMSKQEDSNALGTVLSPAITIISLLLGGFAAGKADKSCALFTSLILGCAALGICYGVSTALDISRGLGQMMKTVIIAMMLLCPIIGAKLAVREKRETRVRRKRM